VQPGSIGDDLLRRDFSINAMAIHLDSACFGELLDPYGGRGDLAQGLIRVLHENSFSDDPTRILRALRYEQRLDFHLEQSTEEWLRRDAVVMDIVTGERLRHELELILSEEEPEKVLSRAYELSVLSKLHPALKGDGWVRERFEWARKASAKPTSAIYLALLAYRLSEEEAKSLIARLKIVGKAAQVMRHAIELRGSLPALAQPQIAPSAIYRLLEKHPLEAIFATAIAVDSPLVREQLELYLTELRYIKPILDGDDLKEMGVPPGRRLGNTLRALHNAKLDGRVRTEGEERELVQRLLRHPEQATP
jgi:tRNA nucleotidyltransferase (CCA-adding enzyme)